jgi:hypothetical protein
MSKLFIQLAILGFLLVGGAFSVTPQQAYAQTCTTLNSVRYICTPRLPDSTRPTLCKITGVGENEMDCTGIPPGYTSATIPKGSVSINKGSVIAGEKATLSWATSDAAGCKINGWSTPNSISGSVVITPDKATSVYTLTCQGISADGQPGGPVVTLNSATITVTEPATDEDEEDPPPEFEEIDNNLTYVPLEPLVGVNQSGQAPFGELIGGFFRILINVGAFLAVVMFVIGGIIYMVSDSTFKKLKGKETVKAALIGLGILAGAWLILNTINPQLLTFDKDFLQPATSITRIEKSPSLIKNGFTRKDVSNTYLNKLEKEFECPKGSGRNCVWDEMLIFEDSKASTSRVKKAIEQFKSDCKGGSLAIFSRWNVKTRSGAIVGAPAKTTVHVCVGTGLIGKD